MGILLFLIAKAMLDININYDVALVCLLASIEFPQWVRIAIYLWKNRNESHST